MDGCEWMRRFKAHLRVGVSFYNIFTGVCVCVGVTVQSTFMGECTFLEDSY